MGFSSEGF